MNTILQDRIFSSASPVLFNELALEIFKFQATENHVYSCFVQNLNINIESVKSIRQIPFLPIDLFKRHAILSGPATGKEITFSSSGTTGTTQSKHLIKDISLYEQSFNKCFELFYGDIKEFAVLALLPSYLERDGSSLIYMVDTLIRESNCSESGYFLYNHADLFKTLQVLQRENRKVILIGVTYALLDFVEKFQVNFPGLIVMETGGMKGKRKEMIREELHSLLRAGFGVNAIHSEYGMTEMLSQAYSKGNGIFDCPPWVKVLTRDTNDPMTLLETDKSGGLNIIDLANLYSCSFLATQDLGKVYENGSFEVLGRFDNSDIRGCNLLVQ